MTLRASARLCGSSDQTAPTTAMRKAAGQFAARPRMITSVKLIVATVNHDCDKVEGGGLSLSRSCLSRCRRCSGWTKPPFRTR